MIDQVVIDTSPATLTALTSPRDIPGMSVSFVYPGYPVTIEAVLPWLKSSVANQIASLYVANAADGVRQFGQPVHVPLAAKNFTLSIRTPALDALRDASGVWQPMVSGNLYTVKLQAAFGVSGDLSFAWSAGTEFSGYLGVG